MKGTRSVIVLRPQDLYYSSLAAKRIVTKFGEQEDWRAHFREKVMSSLQDQVTKVIMEKRDSDKGLSLWILRNFWRCTVKSDTITGNWMSFKNDEKCFLFHLKSSFRSQDISVFVSTFLPCRKTASLERSG